MQYTKTPTGYYKASTFGAGNISYPDSGNEDCYAIEPISQWFNARNLTILKSIQAYPFKGGFLDIGGGNGFQMFYMQKNYFDHISIKSALCEPGEQGCINAASRGVKNVYCCNFKEFPFDEYAVGGIGLFDVLEHIEDDARFLKEIAVFLPVGGRIYITVPALRCLWSAEDEHAGHFRRFDRAQTKRVAAESKLTIIHQSYFFSYYVPIVWLLRVLPEKLGRKPTVDQVRAKGMKHHKPAPVVKALLNMLHYIEMAIGKLGIRPLFGSSRLIILEKPQARGTHPSDAHVPPLA